MDRAGRGKPTLMLYLDNGPVARSLAFQTMMEHLGIDWRTHMPAGSDGHRMTARTKGKVERPFRTVKEAHATLYHFHKPEAEANVWLANLPESDIREMCSWERYCVFAQEPERPRSDQMPASRSAVRMTRLIMISRAKTCCSGEACSIITSSSNGGLSH